MKQRPPTCGKCLFFRPGEKLCYVYCTPAEMHAPGPKIHTFTVYPEERACDLFTPTPNSKHSNIC